MTKLNRFLLADDPRDDNGGLAIIHTVDPICIIGIAEEHIQVPQPFKHFTFVNLDGEEEEWTLYIHHFFTENLNNLDAAVVQEKNEKILEQAWDWYKSYMDWEDKNIDAEEQAALN
jgi:hypothetical protein